jgi:hypothetical protein
MGRYRAGSGPRTDATDLPADRLRVGWTGSAPDLVQRTSDSTVRACAVASDDQTVNAVETMGMAITLAAPSLVVHREGERLAA